jgi:hypothetical protein
MASWRPLSKRDDESYDALHEGVPEWLVASLLDFAEAQLIYVTAHTRRRQPDREKLKEVERKLRVPLDWTEGGDSALLSIRRNVDDRGYFLDLVDFLLSRLETTQGGTSTAKTVEDALAEGGSAWAVRASHEGFRLVRRVDVTVAAAAKAVMSASGRAGQHLAKAWMEVYGRQPDASTAYLEAVRAVEAIGSPIVSPKHRAPTLGTMIADLKNAPAKWTVALKPKAGDPVVMIRETMELLWTAELDRHGTADQSAPLHVSAEEAEAAVHLAVTLVHWFHSGAIKANQ